MKGMVNTMTIQERVSYIKGMMEGMNFEADTNEKKLILAIKLLFFVLLLLDIFNKSIENLLIL